jgi:hypothetical protein
MNNACSLLTDQNQNSPRENGFVPRPVIFFLQHTIPMKRPREYKASKIEDMQKTNLASLYVDQKAAGKTRKEFTAEMVRAGWEFSERQLDRWAARIKLELDAISSESARVRFRP